MALTDVAIRNAKAIGKPRKVADEQYWHETSIAGPNPV